MPHAEDQNLVVRSDFVDDQVRAIAVSSDRRADLVAEASETWELGKQAKGTLQAFMVVVGLNNSELLNPVAEEGGYVCYGSASKTIGHGLAD
jgi:hypothetical protein